MSVRRDHPIEMIGIDGMVHHYPHWLFMILTVTDRRLMRGGAQPILARDRLSGRFCILPLAIDMLRPLLELPHYNPWRRTAAFDPAYHSGRPRRSGRRGLIDMLECGMDAQLVRRELEDAAGAMDHTPLPGREHYQLVAEEAVRQVVAKRRNVA